MSTPRLHVESPLAEGTEVPGSPEFAIANSTMKKANIGMVFTTPP